MSQQENCHVEQLEKPIDITALENARTTFLSVAGMGCEHCAARVRNGLLLQEGVLYVKIGLETGSAAVVYDPVRVRETDLIAAVARSGDDGRHHYQAFVLRSLSAQEVFIYPADED